MQESGTTASLLRCSRRTALQGSLILASRSDVNRGEWQQFQGGPFEVRAIGSVAYKLALVAAGRAHETFTLTPKHEWDVPPAQPRWKSAGGFVSTLAKTGVIANRRNPLLPGLLACGPFLKGELPGML